MTITPNALDGVGSSGNTQNNSTDLYTLIDNNRGRISRESFHVEEVKNAAKRDSMENFEQILRQTVFLSDRDSLTPTCFVILNQDLSRAAASVDKGLAIKWSKKIAQLGQSVGFLSLSIYL